MIAKKNKGADLERKRFAFFQIGLIVSGSLCLAAFEYSTAHSTKEISELAPEGSTLGPEDVPEMPVQKQVEQRTQVFTPDVDTFNIVQHLEKTARFAENKTGETVTFTEGPFEEYGFELDPEETPILDFSDDPPKFPGGDGEMYKWINSQIDYPQMAAEMGIQGTVYVGFVVNTDGSIVAVEALNELNKDLELEAMRVMKKMPRWTPGENAGKKVRVRYQIPFKFSLH